MNVILLYGGRSYERDISIITAVQTADFFPEEYNVTPVLMHNGDLLILKDYRDLSKYDFPKGKKATFCRGGIKIGKRKMRVDCALVAAHGGEGEDGTLASVLSYYDIPYTSCDAYASAICMDKSLTKSVMETLGIPTAKRLTEPSYPCIIKPRRLGSSIGVEVVKDAPSYESALTRARYFDEVLLEEYLENAQELNCAAVFDGKHVLVSAVERPLYSGMILNFEDKYVKGEGREIPADLPPERTKEIRTLTERIYREIGLFGVVRIDYLLANGKLYVNEINAVPGSLAFYLFDKVGISYKTLIRIMVEQGVLRGVPKKIEYKTGVLEGYAQSFNGVKK